MNLNDMSFKGMDLSNIPTAEHLSKDRLGQFTGSSIKNLMGTPAAFQKYVFQKAMERISGVEVSTNPTKDMQWGNDNEPRVLDAFEEATGIEYKHLEYTPYSDSSLMIGCTPDALFSDGLGGEVKSPTSWNGVYDRIAKPWNEKHIDFWQVNTEALCLGVDKIRYIVTLPYQFEYRHQLILEIEASKIHQDMILKKAEIANKVIDKFISCGDFEEAFELF